MNAESNLASSCQGPPPTAVQQNKTIFLSCVRAQLNHHFNIILFSGSHIFCPDASDVNGFKNKESKYPEVEGKDRREENAASVSLKII